MWEGKGAELTLDVFIVLGSRLQMQKEVMLISYAL